MKKKQNDSKLFWGARIKLWSVLLLSLSAILLAIALPTNGQMPATKTPLVVQSQNTLAPISVLSREPDGIAGFICGSCFPSGGPCGGSFQNADAAGNGGNMPNGLVNSSDIAFIKANAGIADPGLNCTNCLADANHNGIVNATDIALAKSLSGTGCCNFVTPTFTGVAPQIFLSGSSEIYYYPSSATNFTVNVIAETTGYSWWGLSFWLETEQAFAPHLTVVNVTYVLPLVDPNSLSPNPAPFTIAQGATTNRMAEARDLGGLADPISGSPIPAGMYHIADITFSVTGCSGSNPPPECTGNYTLRRTSNCPRLSEVTDNTFHDQHLPHTNPASPNGVGSQEVHTFTLSAAVTATGAASRKTHGGAVDFDIDLPLTGTPGIECRSGGASKDFTIVVTFSNGVVGTPTAQVTSGTGCVGSGGTCDLSGQMMLNGSTVMIPLTNVSNQQTINVTVSGGNLAPTVIPMSNLLGDANGNGSVNASDVAQTKSSVGPVDGTNFRSDFTVNGVINSSDVALVKLNSGMSLP